MSNKRPNIYTFCKEIGLTRQEWYKLRLSILRRDKFTCFRCKKRLRNSLLTVHHIIPRAKGVNNSPANLLTLCSECHDYVEDKGLETLSQIMLGFGTIPEVIKREETIYPDWRINVYGNRAEATDPKKKIPDDHQFWKYF